MNFYQKLRKGHLVAAHRGYRSIRPENTLAAFKAAMGHFDFIELDIQPSRDGALMVLHDDTLERTTDIETYSKHPRPHHLIDYDASYLRERDAGSWFRVSDPFGTISNGTVAHQAIVPQKIPTLDEALLLCQRYAMPLNIELKDSPRYDTDTLLSTLMETIAPYRDTLPILISSFNHRYLKELHTYDPTLSLAANVENQHPPHLLDYLTQLGVCSYHVDTLLIDTTPVKALDGLGIHCCAFTVNDPALQEKYYKKGFRALFTDMPIQTL
jgi:glycerophosphoryl diester phosphodiesterase